MLSPEHITRVVSRKQEVTIFEKNKISAGQAFCNEV